MGNDITNVLLRKRGDCYRLLAACFYFPKKDDFMREGLLQTLEDLLNEVCPAASVHAGAMGKALERCSNEDLEPEYARLFVGPFELKAPPYGAVYLDNERKVMGNSTITVMNLYQAEGLSMDKDFSELPDHIAVELEFMYYLAFQEVEARQKEETDKARHFFDVREEFLERFMRPWVPVFCEKIKEETDSPYYRSLADCLSVFLGSKTGTIPVTDEAAKIAAQIKSCA